MTVGRASQGKARQGRAEQGRVKAERGNAGRRAASGKRQRGLAGRTVVTASPRRRRRGRVLYETLLIKSSGYQIERRAGAVVVGRFVQKTQGWSGVCWREEERGEARWCSEGKIAQGRQSGRRAGGQAVQFRQWAPLIGRECYGKNGFSQAPTSENGFNPPPKALQRPSKPPSSGL